MKRNFQETITYETFDYYKVEPLDFKELLNNDKELLLNLVKDKSLYVLIIDFFSYENENDVDMFEFLKSKNNEPEEDFKFEVDFQNIITCIDTLGGLPYDVPFDFKEYDENHKLIYIKQGYQILSGKEVLALARHRKGLLYGDYARCANTQDIIKALIKEYLSIATIPKLINLAESVRSDIEYDELFNLLYDAAIKPLTINSYVIQGTGRNKETASIIGVPLSVIVLEENSLNKAKYLLEDLKDIDLSTLHYNINFYLDIIPSTIKQ